MTSEPAIPEAACPAGHWCAIILAGQRPGGDPLSQAHGVPAKALVPVAGQPMLERVAGLLAAMPEIGRVLVVAQDIAPLQHALPPALSGRREWVAGGDSVSAAAALALRVLDDAWPVLLTTADHPLLTPQIVRTFLAAAGRNAKGVDIGFVESAVIRAEWPDARRTWLKMRDGWYSGANLFALHDTSVFAGLARWESIERDRKKTLRLFARFGPGLLLAALLRRLTLAQALQQAGRRIDPALDVRPVILAHARAAMDVDKLSDHAIADQRLRQEAVD